MTWDETKQTLNDRPDIDSAEKLTSADWNDMVGDQKDHATRHEDGGVDELNVQGLSGLLADPQTPDTEDVQDIVGAFVEAATGSNISVDYDDANDTLTIDTTALNPEETRDTVNDLLVGGTNTTLTYDDDNDTLTIDVDAPTTAEFEDHSTRHESGGADELSVTGLSGDLADEQDAKPHDIGGATHTADTLANLNSKVSDATLDDTNDTREPEAHSTTHESGGADEISVDGLSGDLADAQDPKGHTTTHQSGGSDEIPLNGLELPAGAQIDEDGGDLVVRDSGGSIVLRRDEGAGTWDFVSEDVTGIASLEADGLVVDDTYHWASQYAGSDADTRLDNAISSASDGDTIYLEAGNYNDDRIIDKELLILGTGGNSATGTHSSFTTVDAKWTFEGEVNLRNVTIIEDSGNGLEINTSYVNINTCELGGDGAIVNANNCLINNLLAFSEVTFEEGTEYSTVGVRSTNTVTITDNGDNNIIPLS